MAKYERTPMFKIPYDAEKIALKSIFESPTLAGYRELGARSPKTEAVYGPFRLPEAPADRPYLMASMVLSIDGRIAFEDAPEGPLIAQTNRMDPDGGAADFWVLNMLRTACDGSMFGCGGWTRKEEDSVTAEMFGGDLEGSAHIFDQDLEDARIAEGRNPVPWHVVTSLDGSEIPFEHPFFNNHPMIPLILATSPEGLGRVKARSKAAYTVVSDPERIPEIVGMPVVVTGEGGMPHAPTTMRILKKLGMNRLLIESPSYCHHLIACGLLDELFFNYSCIYVGGKALSLGMLGEAFTSKNHPHTEMLSIHTHGPHFFYFRQRLIY